MSLKEAFLGVQKNIGFSRKSSCRHCQATGALDGRLEQCHHCGGKGVIFQDMIIHGMRYQVRQGCPHCQEKGFRSGPKCPKCGGAKSHMETKTISIEVPAGAEDGQTITLPGEGHLAENSLPGDLVVKIKV